MGSLLFSYKSGFKADDSLQFAILRTAAHELTHHIAERNRRDYQRLQRFVVDNLMDKAWSSSLRRSRPSTPPRALS